MTKQYTFFWSGPFSQWHIAKMNIQGIEYNCAEQYMMYHKALMFGDLEALELIMETSFPNEQKSFGRRVRNFDQNQWNKYAKGIVYVGNYAKFTQHTNLQQYLLETAPTLLVEASPVDRIWGIGLTEKKAMITPQDQWKGTNWLGEVLTQVRDDIISNKPFNIEDYTFI